VAGGAPRVKQDSPSQNPKTHDGFFFIKSNKDANLVLFIKLSNYYESNHSSKVNSNNRMTPIERAISLSRSS
jgi:hypothetical protein